MRRVANETIAEADDILYTFDLLLRIAKADAGVVEEAFTQLDLNAVVEEVVELYAPLAKENDLQLVWRSAPAAQIEGV